jgi:hypothetical protein
MDPKGQPAKKNGVLSTGFHKLVVYGRLLPRYRELQSILFRIRREGFIEKII